MSISETQTDAESSVEPYVILSNSDREILFASVEENLLVTENPLFMLDQKLNTLIATCTLATDPILSHFTQNQNAQIDKILDEIIVHALDHTNGE